MNLEIENMEMKVTNVNTKTENHGDEIVLATDISLMANMPVEALSKFSEADKDWAKQWRALIWNDKGEITGHCLSHLGFHHEFSEHTVKIMDEEQKIMEFHDVRVNNFAAEPMPGYRVNLKFQLRVHPSKHQNGELTALQKTITDVEILGSPQGDMFEEGKGQDDAA